MAIGQGLAAGATGALLEGGRGIQAREGQGAVCGQGREGCRDGLALGEG